MWHVETDIFAIIIMSILIAKNRRLKAGRTDQDRLIAIMLWCSLCLTVIDLVSSIVMNGYGNWLVYEISLIIYYATATLLPCLWLLYGYMQIDGGKLKMTPARFLIAILPQLIITAAALSNPLTDAVFFLTKDMQYSRGPAFMVFTMLYIVYYPVVGLLTIFIYRKKIVPKSNIVALTIFFLIIPVSTALQLKFPGTLLICLAFAVIYVIDDLTIETERRNSLYEQLQEQNTQLEQAARAAERASEAKTQFVSRISHDIRTPIGAILNLTDFAREDMNDTEKLENDLDKIGTSGRFLLSLINDVLDISKIDSGKIELKYERYAYSEYVSEIRNILVPMCEEKGLKCELNAGDPVTGAALTDKVRLNQITLNLLSNAVKYTPPGGTVRFTTASSKLSEGRVQLEFCAEDTGIGMSEEFQKIMFDEFAQEENNPLRQSAAAGTGLGLSIVKKLIDLMGGDIEVESELGKGTRITVRIPMETAEKAGGEADERCASEAHEKLTGRILFAEDNEINTEIALRIFETMGLNAEHAVNGTEAVQMFKEAAADYYSAVFMDIQMPVMNGYEATAAIRALAGGADGSLSEEKRKEAGQIPIIAMTADAFTEAMEKARTCGMTDFVTKPLKTEELRSILEKVTAGPGNGCASFL